jgi:hypothetical protein
MSDTQTPGSRTRPESGDLTAPRTFDRADRAPADLPSREQLLDLVDRAERGQLSLAEAYRLRLGVVWLAAQVEAARSSEAGS